MAQVFQEDFPVTRNGVTYEGVSRCVKLLVFASSPRTSTLTPWPTSRPTSTTLCGSWHPMTLVQAKHRRSETYMSEVCHQMNPYTRPILFLVLWGRLGSQVVKLVTCHAKGTGLIPHNVWCPSMWYAWNIGKSGALHSQKTTGLALWLTNGGSLFSRYQSFSISVDGLRDWVLWGC